MKNIQIAYEVLSESRKLREKFYVTGKQFDKVHANMYSIFECYAHGIITWDQAKGRLKTAIREYVSMYKGTAYLKEEADKMRQEYKRIVVEYKPVLDAYKKVSEQKLANKIVARGQLTESQAQQQSKLYFNRGLSDIQLADTAITETWSNVVKNYPNLTAKDEERVRMLTIFEAPTVNTTQLITSVVNEEPTAISGPLGSSMRPRLRPTSNVGSVEQRPGEPADGSTRGFDIQDPEFNPNAGHRDQPTHPENRGLTRSTAPTTSPRPQTRPANLGQRAAISRALKQAMGEGYKELPPINKDRYQARDGLEGPFMTMAGKVVYYDPIEGAYYDPDSDMYMSYDDFKALDNDRTGMNEAAAKIACLKCDEVSTAKAWQKNGGFCPKCKTSSQGVAEASWVNGKETSGEKRWKQTSMSPAEAVKKYGKENVRVKKKALRNGDDMVEVFVESINLELDEGFFGSKDRYGRYTHPDAGANDEGWDKPAGTPGSAWNEVPRNERPKQYRGNDTKPVLQSYYFFNVPAGQEALAQQIGLKQTKSGKWALAWYNTSGRNAQNILANAEAAFGKGNEWKPKKANEAAQGATAKQEYDFHKKLDNLVHKTFGKRKEEMNEDTESKDGTVKTVTTDYDDESTAFDVYHNGKKVGDGWLDLYSDQLNFDGKWHDLSGYANVAEKLAEILNGVSERKMTEGEFDGHDIMSEDPPNGIDFDYANLSKVNWAQYSEEDIKTFYSIVDNLDFEDGFDLHGDGPSGIHRKAVRWLEDNVLNKLDERKMSKKEKSKEARLKDKYDDSGMKQSMKDQYGDDWESVYYATIRKRAMENFAGAIASVAQPMGKVIKRKKTNEDKPCWDDYEQIGMKKKNGKEVPNCVPKKK